MSNPVNGPLDSFSLEDQLRFLEKEVRKLRPVEDAMKIRMLLSLAETVKAVKAAVGA